MCVCMAACCCCEEYSLLTSAGCSFTDCHNSLSDFIKIRPHTHIHTHTLNTETHIHTPNTETHTHTGRKIGSEREGRGGYWPQALSSTNKTLLTCLLTTYTHTHAHAWTHTQIHSGSRIREVCMEDDLMSHS